MESQNDVQKKEHQVDFQQEISTSLKMWSLSQNVWDVQSLLNNLHFYVFWLNNQPEWSVLQKPVKMYENLKCSATRPSKQLCSFHKQPSMWTLLRKLLRSLKSNSLTINFPLKLYWPTEVACSKPNEKLVKMVHHKILPNRRIKTIKKVMYYLVKNIKEKL